MRTFTRISTNSPWLAILLLLLAAAWFRAGPVLAQAPEIASYKMEVRLDPAAKTVSGTEQITYTNPSSDTLTEVWLHLYLKAFSSFETTWMREAGGISRGEQADASALGDITLEKLALLDGRDLLATAIFSETLVMVPLPQPLGPGETLELEAAWTAKLPRVFARTGYGGRDDTFFMVGQWYPKMAVYFEGQWDTVPWHANSEFFHDFGSYEVSITLPQEYVVAGVGFPASETNSAAGLKTVHYTATNVTDFAFAASPDFRVEMAQAGDVAVLLYYLPENAHLVDIYLETSVDSLQKYSDWYGPYPHPRLTIVDVPSDSEGAGGMEYPTLVTGGDQGLPGRWGFLALVMSHEIAHQWWPMQTASHEGLEPWLDEGLTEYSTLRYMAEAGQKIGAGPFSINADTQDRVGYAFSPGYPGNLPAWEYSELTYAGIVYGKTALGLWTLENVAGPERFQQAMANYLTEWRFKHPTGADFRASLEQSLSKEEVSWFFDDYLATGEVIDYTVGLLENSAEDSHIQLWREGSVHPPVEVQVTFASGRQELITWDGQEESTQLTFPASDPLAQVEIDPERKLMAELDIADNKVGAAFDPGSTAIVGGRLAFWMQLLVSLFGFMG